VRPWTRPVVVDGNAELGDCPAFEDPMRYSSSGRPPSLAGGCHEAPIVPWVADDAVTFRGADGAVAGGGVSTLDRRRTREPDRRTLPSGLDAIRVTLSRNARCAAAPSPAAL
jgi:hypothetical protein